jgi:hypothetical protein
MGLNDVRLRDLDTPLSVAEVEAERHQERVITASRRLWVGKPLPVPD